MKIDKKFYWHALYIAVPIMIQNGITNFVGMLDNIMVGQVGTAQMSGVAIINQILFVFNLAIFGGVSGIGIYTAQYVGKGDREGIRVTFRMKLLLVAVLIAAGIGILLTQGMDLASLWLKGDIRPEELAATMTAARGYMLVMLIGLMPFAMTQVLTSTLRESGETMTPMKAGVVAVFVNLIGNYILIYGSFGAPKLGVVGAAIATVVSRFVECGYVYFWTLKNVDRFPFVRGVFRPVSEAEEIGNYVAPKDGVVALHGPAHGFYIPGALGRKIIIRALPLLLNETLWSLGQTVMSQQYSALGIQVVAAFNINSTIANVFNVAFIAFGDATAIIMGQELGSGQLDTAKHDANRLACFTLLLCVLCGAALFIVAPFFPLIYNTEPEIQALATGLIRCSAVFMPLYAYENSSYFTIRSGGRTGITFLFDSGFVWAVTIPVAFFLTHYTGFTILPIVIIVNLFDFIKAGVGFVMVQSGMWIRNLTREA